MFNVDPASFFFLCGVNPNTYVIYNSEGTNVALAGTGRIDERTGMIWMVATPDLERHSMEFLRYSRRFIEEVGGEYDLLFNWVDARNEVHLKWLKWCGFVPIHRHDQFGAEGLPFYTFIRIK